MAVRILKILSLVLLGLTLIALLLGSWLIATLQGNRELSSLANLIEPRLEVDIRNGDLLHGISAHKISWSDERLTVTASNVISEWEPACFFRQAFCANKVHLESLTVKTRSQNTTPRHEVINIPDIVLPINIAIEDLQIGKLFIDYADNATPFEVDSFKIAASNKGTQVDVKRLSARWRNIVASASGAVNLSDNIDLSLKTSAIVEELADEDNIAINGQVAGSLDNLHITGSSAGLFESTYIASIDILTPGLPGKARITWKNAGWPLADHTIVSSAPGSLFLDGTIEQYAYELKTAVSGKDLPNADIELHGTLTPAGIVAETIDVKTLNGQITGNANCDWANRQEAVEWSTELSFSELNPGVLYADYTGNLAGSVLASGAIHRDKSWSLDLKPAVVQGSVNKQAIHAHAVLSHSNEAKWDIESLRLVSNDNLFTLSGKLGDTWAMRGDLRLSRLQQLVPEAGGSVSGTINLLGPAEQPIAEFDLQSEQLIWQEHKAQDATLSGRIDNFLANSSNISLVAKELLIDGKPIDAFDFQFDGRKTRHSISLNASTANEIKASMSLDGGFVEDDNWQGEIASSTLDLPGHKLDLAAPTNLKFAQSSKTLSIDPHCWENSETSLCLTSPLNASRSGHAEVSLSPYSIRQLNAFLPDHVKLFGNGKANLQLDWGEQIETGFRAVINAQINNGELFVKPQADDEDLQFEYKKLQINTYIDGSDIRTNIIATSTNLGNADISFSIQPDTKPLSFTRGTVMLSGLDVRILKAFFPEIQTIEGTISAEGRITGALVEPAFVGNIKLAGPVIKSDKLPMQITGGQLNAAIAGRRSTITGTLKSGNGTVKVYGEADWEDTTAWSLIVNIQGESLVFSQKPLFESVVAPNIAMSIRPNKVNIGGNVKIAAAAINIKEIPEGATHLSPDIVLAEDITEEAAASQSKWSLASDVTIILGDAVRLSGYGIRAQLKGDFRVVNNDDKPMLVFGEIGIPKGIYKSYGQDLKVVDGQIILVGPINQSTFNIDAYREVDDVTAGLHLSGTINRPLVTLYSDPPLEQERILAYIVLGRDITAGDKNDSNILATAALSMGISNGRGLATNIAEAFGIREFNIEASGRGEDTQVLLSGRISEKLLVRYGVGVFTPVNTLYLRYDLTKNLYLETAQSLESAADLIYSFEF